ncbi:hypothetical protein [Massilia horti]|uniref:Uncharacterized protein n=1 Tax=Massilia horti TaxID=2562153 RepID=A0A4Y9T6W9_9BURK|nr:hypothetical protein [Massilia horti]TFW33005.1 hypothetical protein E4O92_08775 [Massilia horti]
MSATLVLKLFLVPFLIYAITRAGRRWGPGVAGWLSAFPVVAGPILIAVALEHGGAFAATAAEGTLAAVVATLVFCIAYAWSSGAFGVAGSLACALTAYAIAVVVLQATEPSLAMSVVVVGCALSVAPRMFPRLPTADLGGRASNDVIWRMLGAAALVIMVTYSAARLGPRLSGIFAMFPVMGTVLTGFTHAQQGRAQAIATLRGMVLGYWAFAVFCLVVSLLLRHTSVGIAFSAAFLCALAVQLGIKQLQVFRRAARAGT